MPRKTSQSQGERQSRSRQATPRKVNARRRGRDSSSGSESGERANEMDSLTTPTVPSGRTTPRRTTQRAQQRVNQVLLEQDNEGVVEESRLAECMRIIDSLINRAEETFALQFWDLDDPSRVELVPLRADVKIPVDLKLISVKLQKGTFKKRADFLFDIKKMFSNVKTHMALEDGFLYMLDTLEKAFWSKYYTAFANDLNDDDDTSDDDDENLFEPLLVSKEAMKEIKASLFKKLQQSFPANEEGLVDDGEIPGPSSQITNGSGSSRRRVRFVSGQSESADVEEVEIVENIPIVPPPPPPLLMAPPNYKKIQRAKRSAKLPPQPPSTNGTPVTTECEDGVSSGGVLVGSGAALINGIGTEETSASAINHTSESNDGTGNSAVQTEAENLSVKNNPDENTTEIRPPEIAASSSETPLENMGNGDSNSVGDTNLTGETSLFETTTETEVRTRAAASRKRSGSSEEPGSTAPVVQNVNNKTEKTLNFEKRVQAQRFKKPEEGTAFVKRRSPRASKVASEVNGNRVTRASNKAVAVVDQPTDESDSGSGSADAMDRDATDTTEHVDAKIPLGAVAGLIVSAVTGSVNVERQQRENSSESTASASTTNQMENEETTRRGECDTTQNAPTSSRAKRRKLVKVELISDGSDDDDYSLESGSGDQLYQGVNNERALVRVEGAATGELVATPLSDEEKAKLFGNICEMQARKMSTQRLSEIIERFEPELPDSEDFDLELLQPCTLRKLQVVVAVCLKKKLPRLTLSRRPLP